MMLNKLPPNTSINLVLSHLETNTKWGARNRAMFALRQCLRIKDISALQVADVVGFDGAIRGHFISEDGRIFVLDDQLKAELRRYLISRFQLAHDSLTSLLETDLTASLFPTQKRDKFSNNTLAQHFCYLDKSVWERFTPEQVTKKASISQRLLNTFKIIR